VKQHRSHLLVAMTGGAADPVRRRLVITGVTALAARQPGVMAVYWPEARSVHYPPVFVSMAEQQIRIRHCRSSFGHPGKVIRLEP